MAKKQAIIDAAAVLFAEEGYHGATLAKLGERLGITKSAVLYHFTSKDALLDAMLTPVTVAHTAYIAGFDRVPDSLEGRVDVIRGLMGLYAEHRQVCLALQNDRLLWGHSAVEKPMSENYANILRLLCGPGASPDCELRAHAALLVAFRAGTIGLDMSGAVDDEQCVEDTLRLCADILKS